MMNLRRILMAGLAISAMMALTTSAKADPTAETNLYSGGYDYVNINGVVNLVNEVTNFQTKISDNGGATYTTYQSFCVDLFHTINNSSFGALDSPALPVTNTFQGPYGNQAPNGIPASHFGYAAWIANTYGYGSLSVDQQAAVQIAIWKVEFENKGDWTVTGDSTAGIYFTAAGGISAAVLSNAQTIVNASIAAGGGSTPASASAEWVNYAWNGGNHYQYQVIGVPEPSTMAIAGLGALGFLVYGLKRKRV
jgi:hypothetical protein